MDIVRPGDPDYDKDRAISNARFNYSPRAIYYCENAGDVKRAIADSGGTPGSVRIESGGHQHEGMCSADDVLLIDLSRINSIEFLEEKLGRVWIGAGAALGDVYVELWRRGYLFAGGACGDVHVGGLTQGGGWGLASRKFGLTCDSLIGVEIVTAHGDIHQIPRPGHGEDRALLQALRGGGGGNFGVITRFCFRLHPWKPVYTDLTLSWSDQSLPGSSLDTLVLHWIKAFPRDKDTNLTTFLRLGVVGDPTSDRLVIGGRYLGSVYQAQDTMKRLLRGHPLPRVANYQTSPQRDPAVKKGAQRIDAQEWQVLRHRLGSVPEYQPGPALASTGAMGAGGQADLTTTCAGVPLRHKISSGFVQRRVSPKLVPALTRVIRKSVPVVGARQYVSLHCLGGAVFNERLPSAFAFRDRIVLLQYQAWWQPDAAPLDTGLIDWVEKLRKAMTPYTDGAFINFADHDIPLAEYYKDKLSLLKDVKKQWDGGNFFKFEMGIPPAP